MTAAGERDKLLLQIGVQQRLFSQSAADDAAREADGRPLAQVLVERGDLGAEQARGLERAVTYRLGRDEDKRIAQIIIDSGYAPEKRVEDAMRRQKDFYAKTGELLRLATLLLEDGAISDSQQIAAYKLFKIEQAVRRA